MSHTIIILKKKNHRNDIASLLLFHYNMCIYKYRENYSQTIKLNFNYSVPHLQGANCEIIVCCALVECITHNANVWYTQQIIKNMIVNIKTLASLIFSKNYGANF